MTNKEIFDEICQKFGYEENSKESYCAITMTMAIEMIDLALSQPLESGEKEVVNICKCPPLEAIHTLDGEATNWCRNCGRRITR